MQDAPSPYSYRGASPAPTDMAMSVPRRGASEMPSPAAGMRSPSPAPGAHVPVALSATALQQPAAAANPHPSGAYGLPPLALTAVRLQQLNTQNQAAGAAAGGSAARGQRHQRQHSSARRRQPSASPRQPSPGAAGGQRHARGASAGRDDSDAGSNRSRSSSSSSNKSNASSGIMDALGSKFSSARRSVSRVWNTFSAAHFGDNEAPAPVEQSSPSPPANPHSRGGSPLGGSSTANVAAAAALKSYNSPAVKEYRRRLMTKFGVRKRRQQGAGGAGGSSSSDDDDDNTDLFVTSADGARQGRGVAMGGERRTVEDLKEYYVDKRFWEPGFAAGKTELEALPPLTTEREQQREKHMLDVLTKDRTMQARAVDSVLKQRLLENFHVFNEGMAHITAISGDLERTAGDCRDARAKLQHLKSAFVLGGLRIPRLAQRKQRLEGLLDVLELLEMMQLRDREMKTLIKEGRFREAVELSRIGDSFLGGSDAAGHAGGGVPELLRGIKAAETLDRSWRFMCGTLLQHADAAWDSCFARGAFDVERYEGIVEAHAVLRGGQPARVAEAVCANATGAMNRALLSASASKKTSSSIEELVAGIEPSLLVVTMCQVAARITDAVATCLRIERLHMDRIRALEEELRGSTTSPTGNGTGGGGGGGRSLPPPTLTVSSAPGATPRGHRRSASYAREGSPDFGAPVGAGRRAPSVGGAAASGLTPHRSLSRGYFAVGSVDSLPLLYEALAQQQQQQQQPHASQHMRFASASVGRAPSMPGGRTHQVHFDTSVPAAATANSGSSAHQQQQYHAVVDAETHEVIERAQMLTFHRDVLKALQASMGRAGEDVQRQILLLADALVMSGAGGGGPALGMHAQLSMDGGLHIFYILAMAVDCTLHLGANKDTTHGARNTIRDFARQLVESKMYLPRCRDILCAMVQDGWAPLDEGDAAMRDLDIVTGITPDEYQRDRAAIREYVIPEAVRLKEAQDKAAAAAAAAAAGGGGGAAGAGSSAANSRTTTPRRRPDESAPATTTATTTTVKEDASVPPTNPFLEVRMLHERKNALEGLGTVPAKLDDLHSTVCRSSAAVAQLYFNLVCRVVARFPPLATEMRDWAGNVSAMYLYVVAASMIGLSPSDRLQDHPDFAPEATLLLHEIERWARIVYAAAFRGQTITVRVATGGGSGGAGVSTGAVARSGDQTPSRARFHFEELPNRGVPSPAAAGLPSPTTTTAVAAAALGPTVDVTLTDAFPPPVFAGISSLYESEHALFAVRERLTALDGCYTLITVLRQSYESVRHVVSRLVLREQDEYAEKLKVATDHVLHVGCHRLLMAVAGFRNNFSFKYLSDKIADSRWDTNDYSGGAKDTAAGGGGFFGASPRVAAAAGSASHMYGGGFDTRTSDGGAGATAAGGGGGPKYKLCEWVHALEDMCRRFFGNRTLHELLAFKSAHLRNAFWRRFIFEIQRAIVVGFTRSGRATEAVLPVMRAETTRVQRYLKGLFGNGDVFVRESHVFDFLDAFSLDLQGRIRWITENHQYYNSSILTEWFMTLHVASISQHHMDRTLRELRHSDCVVVEPFVAKEREDELQLQQRRD